MRKFVLINLLFVGFLLHPAACQTGTQVNSPDEKTKTVSMFRGHLVLGHEVRSFKPCGTDQESWVLDRTGGDVWEVYKKLTTQPYQLVYV